MLISRTLRTIAGSATLFMLALVTSTAAIAGIAGISSAKAIPTDNDVDIVSRLQEGSMTLEEATRAARAAGLELAIN